MERHIRSAHNAKPDYYLVHGDLTGSWPGLEGDVIIVNWNSRGMAAESLNGAPRSRLRRAEATGVSPLRSGDTPVTKSRFFADRGHRQLIAGYYDGPLARTRERLDKAKGVPGVMGVMFTTWKANYSQLEAFAQMLDAAGF